MLELQTIMLTARAYPKLCPTIERLTILFYIST